MNILDIYNESFSEIQKYCADVDLSHRLSEKIAESISKAIFRVMHTPEATYNENGLKKRSGSFAFSEYGVTLEVNWIWINGLDTNPNMELIKDSAELDITSKKLRVQVKSVNGASRIDHVETKIKRVLLNLWGLGEDMEFQISKTLRMSAVEDLKNFEIYDDLTIKTAKANIIYLAHDYKWEKSVRDCMEYLFFECKNKIHYSKFEIQDYLKDTDIFQKYFLLKRCQNKLDGYPFSFDAMYPLEMSTVILKRLGFLIGRIYYKAMYRERNTEEIHVPTGISFDIIIKKEKIDSINNHFNYLKLQ